MKYLSIGIVLTLLAACSFNQQDTLEVQAIEVGALLSKSEIQNAPIEQQLAYKRHHLKNLAQWLGSRPEVLANLEKVSAFAEPRPYLFEDLLEQQHANGRVSDGSEEYEMLSSSLDAFKGVDGEVYYPSVFMIEGDGYADEVVKEDEFIDEDQVVKEDPLIKSDRLYVAIEDADEKGEKFTAYELIDDGIEEKLIPLKIELTPEFISNDRLMVVELDFCGNTVMDVERNAIDEIVGCGQNAGDPTSGGSTGGSNFNDDLVLNKIKIKDLKESWPGRSEISLKIYKLPAQALVDGTGLSEYCGESIYASDNCTNFRGRRYMRLKRRQKNRVFEVDWLLKNESNNSPDILFYVIFEADGWPVDLQTKEFSIPGAPFVNPKIRFRSWQEEYDYRIVSQSSSQASTYGIPYANTLTIDNSDITYSLKLR